jgi:hypothetical protein
MIALILALTQIGQINATPARQVKCEDSRMITIFVRPYLATIVNFPVKPESVIVGGQKLFSIEYIKSDLAITTLSPHAKTNLFVYLMGRRCGFELISSAGRHDSIINVQDPDEPKLKVKLE